MEFVTTSGSLGQEGNESSALRRKAQTRNADLHGPERAEVRHRFFHGAHCRKRDVCAENIVKCLGVTTNFSHCQPEHNISISRVSLDDPRDQIKSMSAGVFLARASSNILASNGFCVEGGVIHEAQHPHFKKCSRLIAMRIREMLGTEFQTAFHEPLVLFRDNNLRHRMLWFALGVDPTKQVSVWRTTPSSSRPRHS